MDSAGEWKLTSEKPSPTNYSFQRAIGPTWIEQVEQQQRRFSPHARAPPSTLKSDAEQRMPDFLQGVRNPVHSKKQALAELTLDSVSSSDYRPQRHSGAAGNRAIKKAPSPRRRKERV